MDYRNRVVWITGASSGIGEGLAHALAKRGAQLVLSARRINELERVCTACSGMSRPMVLPLDLTKPADFGGAVAEVEAKFGRIDTLIHNAGVAQRSYARETPIEVDRALMEINYFGPVALTKAVLPGMLARGAGHFVVISSVMGKVGTPRRTAYSAAKHALHGFFDSLRAELWREGICVTLVCPGFIQTPLPSAALLADGTPQGRMDALSRQGYPVDKCVAQIMRGLDGEQVEFCVGGAEIWAATIGRLWPSLYRQLIRRVSIS
ncbi:SDR family oxidoreductase [Chitinimonas sp. PSY-7]|uniref:SDR family oxidoreductase n=1 Tax=Chitinimonas sp. PSY-7 TaxID=3459088 RepID=UPI00403FE765